MPAFDAPAFLDSVGVARVLVTYGAGEAIFTQGEPGTHVMYIQAGSVKLSVLAKGGREAIVATLGAGDFFGEGCLTGQPVRTGNATAIDRSGIVLIEKPQMARLLQREHAIAERFIGHMLSRNNRIEADLIDHIFTSSEKRLARTLLLLARYGTQDKPVRMVPEIPRQTLADMTGTTRARVNFFLNKFKKLGFIDYDGGHALTINNSLLSVVLHD
jgi:CRP-like cAMP-binding protein